MDLPGSYVLAARTITAALTAAEHTPVTGLNGMREVTLDAELSGGTGGSTVTAVVRSRIGTDGAWREIARFDFTTAAAKSATVTKGPASVAAFAALSANAVLQNYLGTDLDCIVTSTGTYTGTTLAVRAAVS